MIALTVRNNQLVVAEKTIPKLRDGWALLQVRLAGICNTDVEILRGYHSFAGTPGHEFVADVGEVRGSSAQKKKWMGRRVTGEINVTCSAYGLRPLCEYCRGGNKSHCLRRTVLGIVKLNGAFAEYLTLPLENLHLVPKGIADEQAVFVEPLAAACRILEQLRVKQFSSAAVIGDGKLANLVAQVLRTELAKVTVFGKHGAKLKLLRAHGVTTKTVRGDSADRAHIKEKFPLVVEASGGPSGLELAQHIAKPLGTIVLKSTFHGAPKVELWPVVVNELQMIGSRCGPFDRAIALLRAGKIDTASLITRTFPLEEGQEAIRFAQKPGVMKVLLKPTAS